jgi:hypothetical protein
MSEIKDILEVRAQSKEEFQKKYHLKPLYRMGCWHRVFGKRPRDHGKGCRGPYADHSNTFKDLETGEIVWTEQPYQDIDDIIQEVQEFANKHGLTVRLSMEDSWHYPGSTVLIEYRRKRQTSCEINQEVL